MPEYRIIYRQTEYRTARIEADCLETALDQFVHGDRGEDWFDSADDTEILSAKKEEG